MIPELIGFLDPTQAPQLTKRTNLSRKIMEMINSQRTQKLQIKTLQKIKLQKKKCCGSQEQNIGKLFKIFQIYLIIHLLMIDKKISFLNTDYQIKVNNNRIGRCKLKYLRYYLIVSRYRIRNNVFQFTHNYYNVKKKNLARKTRIAEIGNSA